MPSNRYNRLAAIISERGLSTTGFRRALKGLVDEFVVGDDCLLENDWSVNDAREVTFGEWFGRGSATPAAYRITREGKRNHIYDVTVEVFEVEGTAEIPDWKLEYYGDVADSEGPHLDLHILDKYDHEIVIKSNDLMPFFIFTYYSEADRAQMKKQMRSRARVQHHAPVVIDDGRIAERDEQIRILRRQLAKLEYSQIAGLFQEILYGLGSRRSQRGIAKQLGVEPAIVRATNRLLSANNINARQLVKDTHARWKAAYDAVRELGIQQP